MGKSSSCSTTLTTLGIISIFIILVIVIDVEWKYFFILTTYFKAIDDNVIPEP